MQYKSGGSLTRFLLSKKRFNPSACFLFVLISSAKMAEGWDFEILQQGSAAGRWGGGCGGEAGGPPTGKRGSGLGFSVSGFGGAKPGLGFSVGGFGGAKSGIGISVRGVGGAKSGVGFWVGGWGGASGGLGGGRGGGGGGKGGGWGRTRKRGGIWGWNVWRSGGYFVILQRFTKV